ncbi:inorganic pyrophosphatase [Anaplasma phagocytophilum str. HGE1]|uniref:Inorganic pyrophosphatase n=6 Tax=Anaplasma phagocytophilum TaxID=948 RepID=A0A098EIA6_ANAPH|nr:inorganic pyrophosphatase [Anaplasma phagocytophilum str. HZ2]AGR80274.1 inorganic pyrophosphatase [Anaplasma phagocytophilum str. JM]AGR81528.1 inorganic pyrophosphatase [Anaplasma phagocytophilum str. Dog2]EOA61326.1 inorganic pyrophosphatase [Anaplasma phagocytophilum str. HGE1]CEG21036.1 Inorganic pyrophosphatase [Anaplasma phagocytophilum]
MCRRKGMNLDDIGSGSNAPEEVNVVIEVSQDSHPVKYEFDEKNGALWVDRFLPTAMYYPCNYGFIPNTIAGDGDPVDVLVLARFPVMPGAVICVRPVGVLMMNDEKGEDAKVLAVPATKVDQYYGNIVNYSDLPSSFLDSISHFFSFYKKLEKDKFVSVGCWQDAASAKELIRSAIIAAKKGEN